MPEPGPSSRSRSTSRSKPGGAAARGWIALLAVILALALVPAVAGTFYLELLTKVLILAIFAMSLDLLAGYTGLVSFGHAAFFGIGAYALALLAPRYAAANLFLTLPLSMLAAGAAACAVGALVVRVKGVYFIMVTLAFAQMFYFVFHDTEFGRGSDGISMSFKPVARLGSFVPFDVGSAAQAYWFVLAAALAVYAFLRVMLRSPLGRALQGIRSNEQRMRSLGYPLFRYKLASFTAAGVLAGLAGYLYAMQFGFVNPELLSWHQSGGVLLMLILGGLGTLRGAPLGAFAFVLLQEVYSSITDRWQLPLGLTIIAVVALLPGGLMGLARRLWPAPEGAAPEPEPAGEGGSRG